MTELGRDARHAVSTTRPSTRPVVRMAVDSVYRDMDASVRDRLAGLSDVASSGEEADAALLGRSEVPKLVSALRELLAEHEPDSRGRCRTCRRGWFRRRRVAPCRAYLSAYLCLVLPADEQAEHRHA